MLNRLRDWWRGYSDEDIISAARKIAGEKPWHIVWMSQNEISAYIGEGLTFEYAQRLLKKYEGKL